MWKEIEDYEGYYMVSDSGEIRSIDRYVSDTSGKFKGKQRFLRGRHMKQTMGANGYFVVNLRKDRKSNVIPVHVLVAKAFIPNPLNKPTVNHKDGDKSNNNRINLEWASYSENNLHAIRTGLRTPRHNMINQYNLNGELISTYNSACEASRKTGINRGCISHCINNRTKKAGGYVWKKVSESQTTISKESTWEDELPMEAQRPSL